MSPFCNFLIFHFRAAPTKVSMGGKHEVEREQGKGSKEMVSGVAMVLCRKINAANR
jgi:hypothetical protein